MPAPVPRGVDVDNCEGVAGADDGGSDRELAEESELEASLAMGTSMERGRFGYTCGVIAVGGGIYKKII